MSLSESGSLSPWRSCVSVSVYVPTFFNDIELMEELLSSFNQFAFFSDLKPNITNCKVAEIRNLIKDLNGLKILKISLKILIFEWFY